MKDNAITACPLCWPLGWERTKNRRSSAYKISTDKAVEELLGSIRNMGGRDIILSSNVPVRRDGTMYRGDHSDQRIPDPGVAVYWSQPHPKTRALEPKVIPCDHWYTVRENVRALGMAVDCMRGLARCGAGQIQDRAFSGFSALPERAGEDCWTILGVRRGASRDQCTERLRELTRTSHPDRGGDRQAFSRITEAYHQCLAEAAA